jgi:predicted nucleic acid-binding protein
VSYLLDTNVVSEFRRPALEPRVAAWRESVASEELFISVLVLGEIRRGIERLRKRGDEVQAMMFERWLTETRTLFAERVLAVDGAIAEVWGRIDAASPTPAEDGLMAATAIVHDLTFVTRNVKHVAHTPVRLLNPWDAPPV